MTAVEMDADDSFVGLEDAETRLPAAAAAVKQRVIGAGLFVLVGGIQLAWVAIFAYFAYVFISS